MNRGWTLDRPHLGCGSWLLALVFVLGCAAQAAEQLDVLLEDELLAYAELDEERGMWWSAPLSGTPWIPLGRRGTVVIHHGLGEVPVSVEVYLSFVDDDSQLEKPRSFFLVSGDVANIVRATEDELEIRNNTQGQFYIRVLLR